MARPPPASQRNTRSRLRQQLDELKVEHADALRSETFLGANPEQTKQHEKRQKQIKAVQRQLADFESSPPDSTV